MPYAFDLFYHDFIMKKISFESLFAGVYSQEFSLLRVYLQYNLVTSSLYDILLTKTIQFWHRSNRAKLFSSEHVFSPLKSVPKVKFSSWRYPKMAVRSKTVSLEYYGASNFPYKISDTHVSDCLIF